MLVVLIDEVMDVVGSMLEDVSERDMNIMFLKDGEGNEIIVI